MLKASEGNEIRHYAAGKGRKANPILSQWVEDNKKSLQAEVKAGRPIYFDSSDVETFAAAELANPVGSLCKLIGDTFPNAQRTVIDRKGDEVTKPLHIWLQTMATSFRLPLALRLAIRSANSTESALSVIRK